jgi:archaellum biogenesis protein FlaJ (TadC family)
MSRLNEERTYMMVDAKDDCKDYFDKELETRYSNYENEFNQMLED